MISSPKTWGLTWFPFRIIIGFRSDTRCHTMGTYHNRLVPIFIQATETSYLELAIPNSLPEQD